MVVYTVRRWLCTDTLCERGGVHIRSDVGCVPVHYVNVVVYTYGQTFIFCEGESLRGRLETVSIEGGLKGGLKGGLNPW